MASAKIGEHFEVLEWKINNLCFWNRDIHETRLSQWYSGLHLFPGGLEGDGEHLIVQVYDTHATSVDVSFIGSDGSLLCKQQINNPKWENGIEELPPGPKFEEVVRARKKNPECKDTLTILCRLKKDKGSWYRAETNLVPLDICLRVPNEILEDIQFGLPKLISNISYPLLEEGESFIELFASLKRLVTGFTKIVFTLKAGHSTGTVSVHAFLSLKDTNDSVIMYQENEHIFIHTVEEWMIFNVLQKRSIIGNGYTLFIRLKVVTGIVETNQIYATSLEQFAEVVTTPSDNANSFKVDNSITLLSKELMSLYQDQDHADFNLHCESATFATHKGILSARSPVFKSMLSSGMKEATSGSMKITDLDVNTLGRFLAFLYSGVVEDLQWESALKLYYSADKYEVPSLKNECKAVLTSSVSTSNVCRILSLASKHQDDDLLSVTHEFLSENDYEVLKSEEWESFMLDEPYLASQTATYILLKKSTQKGK